MGLFQRLLFEMNFSCLKTRKSYLVSNLKNMVDVEATLIVVEEFCCSTYNLLMSELVHYHNDEVLFSSVNVVVLL